MNAGARLPGVADVPGERPAIARSTPGTRACVSFVSVTMYRRVAVVRAHAEEADP